MSATQSTFGRRGRELLGHEVVGDPDARDADRRAALAALDQPGDAGLAHQSLHTLAAHAHALRQPQLSVDAPRPIDAAIGLVNGVDLLRQPRVAERPIRRRPTQPVIEPRAADTEQLATDGDRGAGLLRRDEPVDAHRVSVSFAKKAAARLSRSRSIPQPLVLARSSFLPQPRTLIRGRALARTRRRSHAADSCLRNNSGATPISPADGRDRAGRWAAVQRLDRHARA